MTISRLPRRFARRRLGVLVTSLLFAVTAYGQQIVTTPDGESCRVTPDCKIYKYEFRPDPGQTFLRWQVRGDLRLFSPETQNPAEVCSEGYGKGRITAHYYTLRTKGKCVNQECPDTTYHTLDYDLFKQFDLQESIHGPTSVTPGQEVTYWVPPILTDWPHRSAGIGTDTYVWSGFPNAWVVKVAGDSSAITLRVPVASSAFSLTCQVGRCNRPIALTVAMGPEVPVITGGPTCLPVMGTTAFNLSVQAVAHTTYRWLLPAGWQIAPATAAIGVTPAIGITLTVQVTPGRASGDVLVMASDGTHPAQISAPFHLSRQLVPYPGTGLQANYNVLRGCLPPTAPFNTTVTLSNAPTNTTLVWTLPTGWDALPSGVYAATRRGSTQEWTTTSGGIVVIPSGATSGTVQVKTLDCPGGVVQRLLSTTGDQGCTATTYTSIEPGNDPSINHRYTLTALPGWSGCTLAGLEARYTWEINDGTGWVLAPSGPQGYNPTILPVYAEPTATPFPMGTLIRVTVTNSATCLSTAYTRPTPLPAPL